MSDNDEDDGTVKFPEKKKKGPIVTLPSKPVIDYAGLLRVAHIGVIREVLKQMELNPVPDRYNVEVTFDMSHPDVDAPKWVHEQYETLITLVLNQQYVINEVADDFVSVTVYFRGKPAVIVIPFFAITLFRDLYFDLAFGFGEAQMPDEDSKILKEALEEVEKMTEPETAEIVSLDAFRKKDD